MTLASSARHAAEVDGRTARRYWRADAITALCGFVVVLLAVPSSMKVARLGSLGAPTTLVGLAAFLWWCWYHLHRSARREAGVQPVRWALAALLLATLISYIGAFVNPLPGDEVSPADTALVRLIALSGIVLVANDGVRTTARLHTLTRWFVTGAALIGGLSILQFVTGQLWTDRISIPGFARDDAYGLNSRQGLARAAGTASHPLELGAVLAMALPLAIVLAKAERTFRLRTLVPTLLIVLGIVLTLSRSALVCTAVSVILLLPALSRAWRIVGAIGAVVLAGVLYLMVPGLIGTLRGLFLGLATDPSVQSRTGALDLVADFVGRSPWIGRGLGTFLPKYWILDNMYLQLLIEVGIVGVLALLGLAGTAIGCAVKGRRRFESGLNTDLGTALIAAIAAGTISLVFFDAFAFPQATFSLFLFIGVAGAYLELSRHQPAGDGSTFVPQELP